MPLVEVGSRELHGLELDEPVIDAPGRLLGFVNAFGDWACRPPPDALRPGSGNRNGEAGWGLEQDQFSQGVVHWFKSDGGWRKTQFGQGEGARQTAECRKGVCGTQSGQGLHRQRAAMGEPRGKVERPACRC